MLFAFVLAMGVIVLVSNILVEFPINDWLTWGAFSYPVAFLVTDLANYAYGRRAARRVVAAGFAVGVVLSLVLATPRIALASGAAFLISHLSDVEVFHWLRQRLWWLPPVVSSTIASAIDSALFFSLAFAGTGVPWVTLMIGDFAVKLLVAALMLVPFRAVTAVLPPRGAAADAR